MKKIGCICYLLMYVLCLVGCSKGVTEGEYRDSNISLEYEPDKFTVDGSDNSEETYKVIVKNTKDLEVISIQYITLEDTSSFENNQEQAMINLYNKVFDEEETEVKINTGEDNQLECIVNDGTWESKIKILSINEYNVLYVKYSKKVEDDTDTTKESDNCYESIKCNSPEWNLKEGTKPTTEPESTIEPEPVEGNNKLENIEQIHKRYLDICSDNDYMFSVSNEIQKSSTGSFYNIVLTDDNSKEAEISFYEKDDGEIEKSFNISFGSEFDNKAIKDIIEATFLATNSEIDLKSANKNMKEIVVTGTDGLRSKVIENGEYKIYLESDTLDNILTAGSLNLKVIHESEINTTVDKEEYEEYTYDEMRASLNEGEKVYVEAEAFSYTTEPNQIIIKKDDKKILLYYNFEETLTDFELNKKYKFYGVIASAKSEMPCLRLEYYERNSLKKSKAKRKLEKKEIYEYFMKLMDSPDNPENSVRDKSEDYDYDTTEWKKAREEYVDLCNKYFDKALNKTAKKYGITAKKVEEIWSDYEPNSDDEYDDVEEKAISSVLHGELLSANGSGGIDGHTLVVKVKIKPNLTNEMTIKQNYLNVEDIIRNKGGRSYNAIDYWAVADMNNGEEGKVISFTVNRDLIKQIVDLQIPVNKYGDYVDDLWILPSLLE